MSASDAPSASQCSSSSSADLSLVSSLITSHPDFPSAGILFHDVFPIFRNPQATKDLFKHLAQMIRQEYTNVTALVGLDSRGFLFAPPVAAELGIAFVPVRKSGKLPGKTIQLEYATEYSADKIEIQAESLSSTDRVLILDDLLATGGTLKGAASLVEQCGATVLGCIVIVEIDQLKGRERVGAPVHAVFHR